ADGVTALPPAMGTREVRRAWGFTGLRARFVHEVCADVVGGTRLDNLVCDGFLPLLAARETAGEGAGRWPGLWQHWFAGDLPPLVLRGLRELGVFTGPVRPACHGLAQGLLGWLLAQEARR
ncbi:MAG: hypothetical protein NTV51_31245, partial [Verrucomicrobia bacterium]|nr:hypothetical protein [Verrucomicrobiota bacterium]